METAGNNAYARGDYQAALNYYLQASALFPRAKAYRDNVAKARAAISSTAGEAAWRRGDYASAIAYYEQAYRFWPYKPWRDHIDRLKAIMAQQKADQARLAEQARRDAAAQRAAQDRARQEQREQARIGDQKQRDAHGSAQGGSTVFGRGGPVKPDLGGRATGQTLAAKDAGQQASNAQASGAAARSAGETEAKARAGCQFSQTQGCEQGPAITPVDRNAGQSAGAAALLKSVPVAHRNDPVIRNNMAIYRTQDREIEDAQAQIADINRRSGTGREDPKILAAEKATQQRKIERAKALQAAAEEEIHHYVIIWENEPGSEKPQQPEAPKGKGDPE